MRRGGAQGAARLEELTVAHRVYQCCITCPAVVVGTGRCPLPVALFSVVGPCSLGDHPVAIARVLPLQWALTLDTFAVLFVQAPALRAGHVGRHRRLPSMERRTALVLRLKSAPLLHLLTQLHLLLLSVTRSQLS